MPGRPRQISGGGLFGTAGNWPEEGFRRNGRKEAQGAQGAQRESQRDGLTTKNTKCTERKKDGLAAKKHKRRKANQPPLLVGQALA
jgi:hypothetical protein